jgi:hypothetical protein
MDFIMLATFVVACLKGSKRKFCVYEAYTILVDKSKNHWMISTYTAINVSDVRTYQFLIFKV